MNHTVWQERWRGPMLRFACLHLNQAEEAEDVVQDAVLAFLETETNTWSHNDPQRYLFGILKHKITDRLRKRYKNREVHGCEIFSEEMDALMFDQQGHWIDKVAPAPWPRPEEKVQSDQFFAVLDICVRHLADKPAQVFSMRIFLECDAEEICKILGLTQSSYWQCMSRARKQIQLCLNEKWFGGLVL